MKPVGLIDYQIKNSSKKDDLVLDLFGWSWTTLIACEQNGRRCYMMELDPKYVEVVIRRYHNLRPDWEIKCLNRDVDISQILDS
jgi:site-specific DNA-methyltransferase (adenine-specific)